MVVQVVHGDLFEGGACVTVLPFSPKPSVSRFLEQRIRQFDLKDPRKFAYGYKLGDITDLIEFPDDPQITKYYIYAASVFNDNSSTDAIFDIGRKLATLTIKNKEINIIDAPLLGTGAGRLSTEDSALSLARGFNSSCRKDAILQIFAIDYERFSRIQELFKEHNMNSTPRHSIRDKEFLLILNGLLFGIDDEINSLDMKKPNDGKDLDKWQKQKLFC